MSSEKVVYSHQLVITFTQDENAHVLWEIAPDNAVLKTREASYEQLAKAGAPLAALGIRVLFDMLSEQIITLALDKANNQIWREQLGQLQQLLTAEAPVLESGSGTGAEERVVVH
jgi:hypothetical protein